MRVSSSAIDCSNSRKVVFTPAPDSSRGWGSVLHGHRIERAPQVPRGNRAPRAPQVAELAHRARRYLATLEVGEADALLQPEVVERKYVGPQQIEDQEHLGGPAADAAHGDELGDDLLVRHRR